MRQFAVSSLTVFTIFYCAFGADIPAEASEAPASYNWTGFYTGAHLDYQAGQSRWSESRFGARGGGGMFDVGKGYDFSFGTGSYAIGFQGRYDYMDASHHVFGLEGDIWFPNTVSGSQNFTAAAVGAATYSEMISVLGYPPRPARICGRQLAALSHGWVCLEF